MAGETTPRSITKRYRLVMTMVILLLVAFVASFFSFPHGSWDVEFGSCRAAECCSKR